MKEGDKLGEKSISTTLDHEIGHSESVVSFKHSTRLSRTIESQENPETVARNSNSDTSFNSDSELDTSTILPDNPLRLTNNLLSRLLTTHLHCDTHCTPQPQMHISSLPLDFAQLNRFFEETFPSEYPQPSKFGFNTELNSDIWRRILFGLSEHHPTSSSIPQLDPHNQQSSSLDLTFTYDIDSFIAKATDLGIAKVGLNIQLCPNQLHNISKNLHLAVPIPAGRDRGDIRFQHVPLHQIPHFRLGTIHSALFLPLYIFFPMLYDSSSTTSNFVSNQHIKQWMDHGLLPSLYRHYSDDILQHIPSSYDVAYMAIYARSRELGQQDSNQPTSISRRQELHYFIPSEGLEKVWKDIEIFSRQPGYDYFQNMFLLLDGKDLKLMTKSNSISQSWTRFKRYLDLDLKVNKLDPNFCYLDLAQEGMDSQSEQIVLWKTCCLRNGNQQIRSQTSGIRAAIYNWALTSIVANRTIQFSPYSTIYKSGFVYSQSYSPLKCLFEVAGNYPFQNPSLDFLSLTPEAIKSWQATGPEGVGLKFNIGKIEDAYIHGRDRVLAAIDSAIRRKRSYGIRQEHRISLNLFTEILETTGDLESSQEIALSCLSIPSGDVLRFLRFNFLRFGLALEYTALQLRNPINHYSISHGRMVRMFLQLQRNSVSSTILEAAGDLWRDYPIATSRVQSRGLGLKVALGRYNFAWIPQDSLDLTTWTMGTRFQQSTAFTFIQLPIHLHSKTPILLQKQTDLDILQDFRKLLSKINNPQSKNTYKTLSYLGTMAIKHFRRDIWTSLNNFCPCLWNNEQKLQAALNGQVPLELNNVSNFNPSRYSQIRYSNKHHFTLQERWEILFHWDDRWDQQNLRQAWKNWPFRIFFQSCYTMISEICNLETANIWESQLVQRQFVRSNLLLPSPSKQNLLQRNTAKGCKPRIYWVPLMHCSWTEEATSLTLPTAYSISDKWESWQIDYEIHSQHRSSILEPLYEERLSPEDFLNQSLLKIA